MMGQVKYSMLTNVSKGFVGSVVLKESFIKGELQLRVFFATYVLLNFSMSYTVFVQLSSHLAQSFTFVMLSANLTMQPSCSNVQYGIDAETTFESLREN